MSDKYIICVDDEPLVLESLLRELESEFSPSYRIETAENGMEALDILEDIIKKGHETPAVVVDYIMPNMKGDELLKEIHRISPETKNIMLTGQATMDGVTNAINWAQLYRYLSKPWTKNDLVLTLKEAIKSYDLGRELVMRNKELKNANEKLTKLDSAKSYFLGLLSHELNTPLIGINGNAKLIMSYVDDDDVVNSCNEILLSESRLRRMAEMSLLITRLRTDKYAVKTYPEILTNLIDEAILKNEPTAGEKNVKFIRDYENIQNKTIDGDFSLIFKVLDMVIENAVKFSPKGAEVTISGGIIGGRMIAEIIDRGPGFSANALDNLFEMFSSGELMSHSEGAGLSLAAAKVIMEAHNFDINAANNESGGASVILTF